MTYDERTSKRLNGLENLLADAVEARDAAIAKYDAAFLQVFSEFTQATGSEQESASFICDDGMKLARLVPNMQPVIDHDKLLLAISNHMGVDAANRLWKRITEVKRTVVQDKLAEVIMKNPALGEAIDAAQCISKPTRKPTRYRQPASKDELMMLEVQRKHRETNAEEEEGIAAG